VAIFLQFFAALGRLFIVSDLDTREATSCEMLASKEKKQPSQPSLSLLLLDI
jgi:hypothetical protein